MTTGSKVNVSEAERAGSVLLGAVLTLCGWNRKGLAGALMRLIGGALFFRGVSGWCGTYRLLGINTACQSCAAPDSGELEVD